jgi:hypothetical protein
MQKTAKTASPLTMVYISSSQLDIRDLTHPRRPLGMVGLFRRADGGENGVVPSFRAPSTSSLRGAGPKHRVKVKEPEASGHLSWSRSVGLASSNPSRSAALPEPNGGTRDEVHADWCGCSLSFRVRKPGNGGTSCCLQPCPEHLLRNQRTGKSPQQILRLHRMVSVAVARRLGQFAGQCLFARPQLHTGRMRLQSAGPALR